MPVSYALCPVLCAVSQNLGRYGRFTRSACHSYVVPVGHWINRMTSHIHSHVSQAVGHHINLRISHTYSHVSQALPHFWPSLSLWHLRSQRLQELSQPAPLRKPVPFGSCYSAWQGRWSHGPGPARALPWAWPQMQEPLKPMQEPLWYTMVCQVLSARAFLGMSCAQLLGGPPATGQTPSYWADPQLLGRPPAWAMHRQERAQLKNH